MSLVSTNFLFQSKIHRTPLTFQLKRKFNEQQNRKKNRVKTNSNKFNCRSTYYWFKIYRRYLITHLHLMSITIEEKYNRLIKMTNGLLSHALILVLRNPHGQL